MDTTPSGEDRDYAVGRLASRGTDPGPLPADPAEHAVHDAEQIVCGSRIPKPAEGRGG